MNQIKEVTTDYSKKSILNKFFIKPPLKHQFYHSRQYSDPEYHFALPNRVTSRFSLSHPDIFLTTQQTIPEATLHPLTRSPSKNSNLPKKRELSPDELSEIEKIVQKKLSVRVASLKSSISRKITQKSSQNVLKPDLNSLRKNSLISIETTKLKKQILPQLKREALSEVLINRKNSKKFNKRELVLAEMEDLLVKKNKFVPLKLFPTGVDKDIGDACVEAQKSMRGYEVKPINIV